jgi:preprotein translocase subunit SecA
MLDFFNKIYFLYMGFINKMFGDPNEKTVKLILPIVEEINRLEERFKTMSDDELKSLTFKFKERLGVIIKEDEVNEKMSEKRNPDLTPEKTDTEKMLDKILPEAFAVVREASRRILGQRHYDMQLVGGIVLHRGQIAEMKTGEGKTLVATLPLYLNALAGKGVQLITVNDYLSRVGAGWMAPVFYALGMSTGVIVHETAYIYDPDFVDETQYDKRLKHFRKVERKDAYNCDILYGTNNEFGFDYLRDNMVPSLERMVQRDLFYAIVDEIDSILIDEARTPLIISAPAEESTDKYYKFSQLVVRLKENEDYNVDEKMRAATLTEEGIAKMEKWLGVENIYTAGGIREVHHIEQALKAHALFRLDRDYVVKDGEVIIVDEFTGRLMHGRRYSEGLHQAIEAKEGVKVQRESETLATITFQNFFRMYHKLSGMTGTAMTEAEEFSKIYKLETVSIPTNKPMIRKDLNDLIYRSEEGKFKAVIADIKQRHEAGQPILIGTISIEKNEILADMMARSGLQPQMLNAKNHEKEARIITEAGKVGAITLATNMAGRGVDIMLGGVEPAFAEATAGKPALESEEHKLWKQEHEKIIALGGLHVIGTERHESRRIDNQLRGRAGRQGDPGSSQFYVSTDDDLMRIFGGDRMKSLMTTLRVPEDMPIENSLISKSIESAQRKVEGNNFDIRKHLVEYDDVINKHREAIYRRRKDILLKTERVLKHNQGKADKEQITEDEAGQAQQSMPIANQLSDIILEMVENEIEQAVSFHTSDDKMTEWNINEIYQVISTIFPVEEKLKSELAVFTKDGDKLDKAKARTEIIEFLAVLAREVYDKIKNRAEDAGLSWVEIEKAILIRSIDMLWIEHLEAMASVRQGIGLRGYGQRDPLIEYKKEAYLLYNELNNLIQKEVVYSIYKVGDLYQTLGKNIEGPSLADRAKMFSAPAKEMSSRQSSFSGFKQADAKPNSTIDSISQKVKDESGNKIGRNDLCPCGSGKKYKKCCGK